MTIRDKVREWLGIYPDTQSQLARDVFFVREQLKRIEGKIDELKFVPKANIHLRPPVPTDWDTAQLQALYDLSDKKEN